MNLSYRRGFLSLAITAAISVVVNSEQIQATGRSDITALLKFAEQYNAENGDNLPPPPTLESSQKSVSTHQKTSNVRRTNKTVPLNELKKKEAEIIHLQQKIASLEKQLNEPKIHVPEIQPTVALLSEEQLNNFGQIIRVFKRTFSVDREQTLQTRLNSAQEKLRNTEEENALLRFKNETADKEYAELQQKLSEVNNDTQQQNNETVASYHQEIENLKHEKSKVEEQLTVINQEKEKLQQDVIELTQKLDIAVAKQETELGEAHSVQEERQTVFNQQILLLNQEKAALQSQISKINQDKQHLEQQLANLTQQFETLQSELSVAKNKYEAEQQRMKSEFDAILKDEKLTLETQIASINQEKQKLEEEIQEHAKKQEEIQANHKETIAKYTAENSQYDLLKKQFSELTEQYQRLETQFVSLTAVYPTIQNDILNKEDVRLDYAAGVTLGYDILAIQAEQKKWGLESNEQVILSGILDVFSDQVRLDEQTLKQVMAVSEKQIVEAHEKFVNEQAKVGGEYLTKFSQQKGVKKSEMGFWYLIDYPGDDLIPDGAMVDIVINESLTDGTVIKDMDAQGIVLSHRIDEFPPLFAQAIKLLKNHGSMTMVVPPELAYGKEGYQPYIPPDSTMVYHIRISDAYLADK